MDQDVAKKLFFEGATLLVLDMPVGSEFGIDYNAWKTGEMFRGVKMIPHGLHFVYFSAVDSTGQTAPRTGFFHFFSRKEILIKKWNKRTEDLDDALVTDEDVQRYRSGLQDLDKHLGPYPYDSMKTWVALTNHISEPLLKTLQPLCGKILSVSQVESAKESDEATPVPATQLRFSALSEKLSPPGSSPAEVTQHALDQTYSLEILLRDSYDNNYKSVLGELQFAFVCFLIGHVYDAFEHWKKLARLLCSCDRALSLYTDLYMGFIGALHFQVKEIPNDFFVDIVEKENFLTTTLQVFFSFLEESSVVHPKLKRRGLQFRKHLTEKFKWDFTLEPDDCAPALVEL